MNTFARTLSTSVIAAIVGMTSFNGAAGAAETAAKPKPKTMHMIVLGDSISAGYIAYTALKDDPKGAGLKSMSADEEEDPPPPMMKYGFRYASVLESKGGHSWVTGDQHESIADRLATYLNRTQGPTKLKYLNMAESGSLALHIPRQIKIGYEKRAKADVQAPIALVTLMIGANDACQRLTTSPDEAAQIKANIRKTFQRLSDGRPSSMKTQIPVFVSSVPMIPNLGTPEILNAKAYLGKTCADVRRDILNMCPTLSNWTTQKDYAVRVNRVNFINQTLKEAVASAKREFPKLSLVWDEGFVNYNFRGSLLAADCFHPGRRGQAELADVMWHGMPWFQNQQLP